MVDNNFPKHKLIVPTLCVGTQPEPLCGSGRRSVPDWVTTQSVGNPKRKLLLMGSLLFLYPVFFVPFMDYFFVTSVF